QIAVLIPMTLYQTGNDFVSVNPQPDGTMVKGAEGYAFGDPRLHLKVLLYGKEYGFKISLSHWLSFPFGNDSEFGGERHFDGFAGEPRVLAGYDAERWRVGAYFGFVWRVHESQFFSTKVGHQLSYGGAVAVDAVKNRFTVLAEIFGRSELGTDINNAP